MISVNFNRKSSQAAAVRARSLTVVPKALFSRKAKTAVKEPETTEPPRRKESTVSQTLQALDFSAPRSKRDADLLYEAKYGKRGEDGRMSREQYGALRRKIGGTAKDYWKDWIEEERVENTYYKPNEAGGSVPYLPVLVGILVAVLGTTVLVVQQTGGSH